MSKTNELQSKIGAMFGSVDEIEKNEKRKQEIDEENEKKRKEGKGEAIFIIRQLMATFSISEGDLFATTTEKRKNQPASKKSMYDFVVGAIYEKDGNKWEYTGKKGRRPAWVSEAIESGTIAKHQIKKPT
ncbi:H-NS family nucleoid-associated regulatory protein [Limnohabitans lacus]|uniref:H-NS histone family protein n=1 Tax=Limnohabitans lacus TaxID=3045173 RepID=A0ABT6X6I2_9BURK|nr:H-NS family nucleoid-associated regulatory protein [Limnohabitans sp. HM2-2]MDI9233712.1 H-NS histone family protein [Limnohabitans sp. HM2-2]